MKKKKNPKQWRESMMESVSGSGETAVSGKGTLETSQQSLQAFTRSPNCSLTHAHSPTWAFIHSLTGSLVNDHPIR